MASTIHVNFTNEFKGELIAPKGTTKIGVEEGTLNPYDMLFGALASCLYATFLSVANKKKISFDSAKVEVSGEKRKEVPMTLSWVHVKVTIKNAEKESGLVRAMELATQYCSIYETVSKVAEMTWEVEFE